MNPEAILSAPDTLDRIEAACRRRFFDEADAVQCTTCVIDALRESDYRRIRSFDGRSRFSNYLHALIANWAVECHRKRYGRRRIPRAVAGLGRTAEEIYRLVCWNGFSFGEAYELLRGRGAFGGTFQEYEGRYAPVCSAPCEKEPRPVSLDGGPEDPPAAPAAAEPNPLEALLERLDRERRILACAVIGEAVADFSDEDRLLFKLIYGDDHSAAAAGRVLGLADHVARRRNRRMVNRVKEKLLAEGIREW